MLGVKDHVIILSLYINFTIDTINRIGNGSRARHILVAIFVQDSKLGSAMHFFIATCLANYFSPEEPYITVALLINPLSTID